MSNIAFLTLIIALGAVLGILLGEVRYRRIGLGIGGVLFSGILVGHFAHAWFGLDIRSAGVLTPEGSILSYVQEFGLILFVYAIGVQVGPSFFATLRGIGIKLIGWAVLIVLGGCIVSMTLFFCGIVNLDAMIGMYSGAITNTPALGAGTSMINDMAAAFAGSGQDPVAMGLDGSVVPSAYAMAYPLAVCSLLFVMILLRIVFKIDIDKAGEVYHLGKNKGDQKLLTLNVEVNSDEFIGKRVDDIPGIKTGALVCSRIMHHEVLDIPKTDQILEKGDVLHLVGLPHNLKTAVNMLGLTSKQILTTRGTMIHVRHLIVTKSDIIGKTLGELDLERKFGVVVSRVIRGGVQFMPTYTFRLQFGDEINVLGRLENIHTAGRFVGNSSATMKKVEMLPLFIGIGLGILLGSIPIAIPGIPAPMKLGLAGGPLIMAILLARFGGTLTRNRMQWRLPGSALSAFRELGITLFLTIVGICAGASGFWETLVSGPGLKWMCWAVLISLIPILIVGFLAMKISKINYLVLSGMIAGAYTDPPALAYANGMYKDSEASSIGYATVYPFVMFLRILSPQIMIIIAVAFI